MSTVTVYTFEDADGTEDTYTTQSAVEAKDRGQREQMRVIANEYEWTDSEVAWDFTCRRCAEHDPRDRRDHGHVPDEILNRNHSERSCNECGATLTDRYTSLVHTDHDPTCSLHPSAVDHAQAPVWRNKT